MAPLRGFSALLRREVTMPWNNVKQWDPFNIDALGLITLLGAEDVSRTVGSLQKRRFSEWFPLLGAFVIAGNRFTSGQPGTLYNLTDGIQVTQLQGWFSRWVEGQDVRDAITVFRWSIQPKKPRLQVAKKGSTQESSENDEGSIYAIGIFSFLLGMAFTLPLLPFTIVIGDWWGIANAVSIITSIFVRKYLLWQLRSSLTKMDYTAHDHIGHADDEIQLLVMRSDGRMVTMYMPRQVLKKIVMRLPIPYPVSYHFVRWIGWLAFGAQVVTLGMSTLFTQLYTVVLLVMCTWFMIHDFTFDFDRKYSEREAKDGGVCEIVQHTFGRYLKVEQENPASDDRRMNAYVHLELDERQERMMKHMNLLPFDNTQWYSDYDAAKTRYRQRTSSLSNPAQLPCAVTHGSH